MKIDRIGNNFYCEPIIIGNNKYEVIARPSNAATNEHVESYLTQILAANTSQYDIERITKYIKGLLSKVGNDKRITLKRVAYDIPLLDNHSHLGGSIEPELIGALMAKHGNRDVRIGKVRKSMTYQNRKPSDFAAFIKKFELLNKVRWTEEDIYDSIHQVVSKIGRDGVEGSEIRFSIGKYRPFLKMSDPEIIRLIKNAFDEASDYFNVKISLVLSFRHNASEESIKCALELDKYQDCVVGIDLSGDEKFMDVDKFQKVYEIWGKAGKTLMAHVGEQPGTGNHVRKAIEEWGISRVAHGIYSDKYTLDMAKDKGICFDVAISSNYYTGVVKHRHAHPAIKMLENGNIVTLGTDDCSVFCTTLRKEYALAKEYLGLSDSNINDLKINSIKYSTFDIDYGHL